MAGGAGGGDRSASRDRDVRIASAAGGKQLAGFGGNAGGLGREQQAAGTWRGRIEIRTAERGAAALGVGGALSASDAGRDRQIRRSLFPVLRGYGPGTAGAL